MISSMLTIDTILQSLPHFRDKQRVKSDVSAVLQAHPLLRPGMESPCLYCKGYGEVV